VTNQQLYGEQVLKHVVGIADMKLSANACDTLITFALGSCLGIVLYDPVVRVGALLHLMLPDSGIDPAKAQQNPWMFVDTGFPRMLNECLAAGASRERLILKVAGGACAHGNPDEDYFQIGKRNFVMLRKMLWQTGILLKAHDIGGSVSRTMSLEIGSGEVQLKVSGITKSL
jgi:chemotaxis protein CheD